MALHEGLLGGGRTRAWQRYVRPALPAVIALYLPLFVMLATTRWVLHSHAPNVVEPLSGDVRGALDHSSFLLLEVGLWVCAVIVAFLGYRGAQVVGDRGRGSRLCAGAGLLSFVFLLDDLFQLHKPVIPDATGLPSGVLLVAYAAALAWWVIACRDEILRTDVGILASALAFFGLWFVYKLGVGLPAETPVEVSAKLCGIAGWTLYVWRASVSAIASRRRPTVR